ncbi:MAG: hypothetical protein L7H18_04210 [Candidatus Nealsonbacteria bacterium DGGOD1a]|nr:MAG: hypothetical protein L7H18_04210 [Candidatus Nealsonbacteria bacterium DGGOD1a]
MIDQKNKIKMILAAIILVSAAAGTGFYLMFGQNNFQAGDFAGWKTYKNGEYGFELKYPAELAKKEKTANPSDGTEGGIGFTLYENADPANDKKAEAMVFSAGKFVSNPDKSAIAAPLAEDECKIPAADALNQSIKLTDKNISGANFTRIETGQDETAQGGMASHYIGYVAKIKDVCYRFVFFYAKDGNEGKQTDIDLFEKIISTVTLASS